MTCTKLTDGDPQPFSPIRLIAVQSVLQLRRKGVPEGLFSRLRELHPC